jgi:LacI family transcriptional regulator
MNHAPRVILLPDPGRGFGRGVIRGVSRYASIEGGWSFYYQPPRYLKRTKRLDLEELRKWKPDGIICAMAQAELLAELKIPMICYDPGQYEGEIPCLVSDDATIGDLAANHLIEQGHRNFAFFGYGTLPWSENRKQGFSERLSKNGYSIQSTGPHKSSSSWSEEEKLIEAWLHELPNPIGIFCANDDRAASIMDVTQRLGLNVPHDISIIGADNDEIICEVMNPPLSSIRIQADQAGYEAAALLGRLMRGEEKSKGQRLVAPTSGVIARQSTNLLMIKNQQVRKALQFIRENVNTPIRVSEVVRRSGMSHRSLNEMFHSELGISIGNYVTKARIDHISRLLLETDLRIQEVASFVGYDDDRHFSRYFKRSTGMTPRAYRRKVQTP